MAIAAHLALLSVFIFLAAHAEQSSLLYHGFNDTSLDREGAFVVKPSGALRLTNTSQNVIGHAFFPTSFPMFEQSSDSFPNVSSFSTIFVFAIEPSSPGEGGYGLAFAIAPSTKFSGAESGHYLGLFNSSNNGNPSNHIFAIEFDTVNGHGEERNTKGNHVGIDINNISSVASKPASYSDYGEAHEHDLQMDSGDPIIAWVEYDGPKRIVNVTLAPWKHQRKPTKPLLSYPIDLKPFLKEQMFVGFTASTGDKTSSHYILGWSFAMNGPAPLLNYSLLPNPPKEQDSPSSSPKSHVKVFVAVISVVAILGILFLAFWYRKTWHTERLEDWERDCPHRFHYTDLHEEWEQVVIHRDVKPSNVLIDADMNPRLSDFGLARQYDHDEASHTTGVVGTIGYIAPELVRTGKASKSTDVFGYGVLLLEVACGRKPLKSEEFILVDWVMEQYEKGKILDAADPKLNWEYEAEEMEMVLVLGLHCSHQIAEARPTMRRVMRILDGDDKISAVEGWDCSQNYSKFNSRMTEVISATSYRSSSSIGDISSTSIDAGR